MAETIANEPTEATPPTARRKRRWVIRGIKVVLALTILWLIAAYLILPALWRHYEHHPSLQTAPKTTLTKQGIPGDALNIGLIGSEDEVVHAMLAAGWVPADPVTFKSSLRIARSVVMRTAYADAPVSSLFVFGRQQDLAFEKPVGDSAKRRHHVRFWRADEFGQDGVPLWIGAATFDRSVGLSHLTGQITHHISPDIDAERDGLIADLTAAGALTKLYQVTGVGATLSGRNGGGDRYFTDGELTIGVLLKDGATGHAPDRLENPVAIRIKAQLWSAVRPLLQSASQP